MSEYICYLITVLYRENNTLLKCALEIHHDSISQDCRDYPLEPLSRAELLKHLPMHVKGYGNIIVDVEEIFSVEKPDSKAGL